MDNFTVGNVTQNLNEYLLDLKVDYMTLSIATEQGECASDGLSKSQSSFQKVDAQRAGERSKSER